MLRTTHEPYSKTKILYYKFSVYIVIISFITTLLGLLVTLSELFVIKLKKTTYFITEGIKSAFIVG